jgi:transcriptional regulator with GAF, ATPase, and Fis domain
VADPAKYSVEELRVLYDVARRLLLPGEYGELLAGLLDATMAAVGAQRGFVVVNDAGTYRATVARNYRSEALDEAEREVSSSISAAVVASGRAVLIDNASQSQQFAQNPSVRRMALRSVLCAPLIAGQETFALIYLENRDIASFFTERQRELLDDICALAGPRLQAAVMVEHARQRASELATGGEEGILTADAGMAAVLRSARQVAPTELPVLIQGETGTGKELVARLIYRNSRRSSAAYVVINCGAIPATLIESELFGYMRGAFTGATRDHVGLIASAHRGTILLDEVGELPLELQSRLLRVLQSGELMRVGAVRPETVDVRFIAATNRDLEKEVAAGRFRQDLYFRLAAITLKLPPLRERPADIRLLTAHFLRIYASRYGRPAPQLGDDVMLALTAYAFPGNVRELESEMARLVAMSAPGTTISAEALSERVRGGRAASREVSLPPMALEEMERRLILSVLEKTSGNRTRAAEILGISREGLRTKMQRLGIEVAAAGES